MTDARSDQRFAPLSIGRPGATPPAGWRWVRLTDVARLESGHTPSRNHPEWWGGDIPWLALPDIRALDGRIAHDTAERTNDLGIANSSARVLPAGTVVLSRTASVGFVTIMGRPMATSQDFVNWVCGPDLDPQFLAILLRASREQIRGLAAGAVHKTVYVPTVQAFHVCIPDVATQRRIAKQVRERLAEQARTHTALLEQMRLADALPDSMLREAFQGGTPISAGGASHDAPPRWQWRPIMSVARLESGHTPSRRHPEWWGGDIPWIALPDIRALDGVIAHDTAEHTNELGIANSSARVLPIGTVVMSRDASIGFVTIMGRPMATSQHFVNWVCGPELNPHFLAYALRTSRSYIRSLASGSVLPTIYMPTLHSLQVCMPPIEEQRRIVAQLDARLTEAHRLRVALATRRVEIEALSAAILTAAFGTAVAASFESVSKQVPAGVLPGEQTDYSRRGAIAAYLVDRLHAQPTFGRVMFQKLLYLAEAHVGVALGGEYERRAAGPLAVRQLPILEQISADEQWFVRIKRDSGKGYRYVPGARIGERVTEAERMLGARRVELDRLIKLLGGELTARAEVVATLFAAWNDFLIDGYRPTDEEIVREMRTNWHPKKGRFAEEGLHRALAWMRRMKIVPTGRGPRTRMQQLA